MSQVPNLLFNKKTHDAVSAGADIAGVSVLIADSMLVAVHSIVTGSPTGTLTIQGSNVDSDSSYVTLTTHALSGSAALFLDNYQPGYIFIRAKYTFSSGSGTLTVYISGKAN
jgi:hypothetical protein